ncbi:MAG: hypothetical protein IMF07_02650 [Proteobacteria bacterium]|nr:hypothetical protein [Pseudomonadota bacterium]
MVWNIFMHVLIGLFGIHHFTLTMAGILFAILIVVFTQAAELVRFYMDRKKEIGKLPAGESKVKMEEFKNSLPRTLPGMFAQNMILYTAIVLTSAEIGRTTGYGI